MHANASSNRPTPARLATLARALRHSMRALEASAHAQELARREADHGERYAAETRTGLSFLWPD